MFPSCVNCLSLVAQLRVMRSCIEFIENRGDAASDNDNGSVSNVSGVNIFLAIYFVKYVN